MFIRSSKTRGEWCKNYAINKTQRKVHGVLVTGLRGTDREGKGGKGVKFLARIFKVYTYKQGGPGSVESEGGSPLDKVFTYLIFANGTKIRDHLNQLLGPWSGWCGVRGPRAELPEFLSKSTL